MKVTAWSNGSPRSSGAGYGLKVAFNDVATFSKWKTVILHLEGDDDSITVNVDKESFRNGRCRELIKKEIGLWLIYNKKAPWPRGNPPQFYMVHQGKNHYEIKL